MRPMKMGFSHSPYTAHALPLTPLLLSLPSYTPTLPNYIGRIGKYKGYKELALDVHWTYIGRDIGRKPPRCKICPKKPF